MYCVCSSCKQIKTSQLETKHEFIKTSYFCKDFSSDSVTSNSIVIGNLCGIFKEELNDSTKVSLHLSGSLEYGVLIQTQGFYHVLDKNNMKKSEMKRLDFVYIPFLESQDKKHSAHTKKDFQLRELQFSFPEYDKIPQVEAQVSILIN